VRQDAIGPSLRSPARRSQTLQDNRPSHYHSSFDLFHQHQPQHPAQLRHPDNARQTTTTPPVRLQGRVNRHQSSPQLQLQQQLQQLDAEQLQQQQSEPVYEELTAAVVKSGQASASAAAAAAAAADSEMMMVESGQYVMLQGGADSSAPAADSLRQIIKHNPTAPTQPQPHHPTSVDRQDC